MRGRPRAYAVSRIVSGTRRSRSLFAGPDDHRDQGIDRQRQRAGSSCARNGPWVRTMIWKMNRPMMIEWRRQEECSLTE